MLIRCHSNRRSSGDGVCLILERNTLWGEFDCNKYIALSSYEEMPFSVSRIEAVNAAIGVLSTITTGNPVTETPVPALWSKPFIFCKSWCRWKSWCITKNKMQSAVGSHMGSVSSCYSRSCHEIKHLVWIILQNLNKAKQNPPWPV